MDITPEFVKMCEKAVEIQAQHQWAKCDFFVSKYGNEKELKCLIESWWYYQSSLIYEVMGTEIEYLDEGEAIWLPRQDQLQAMVGNLDESFEVLDHWREGGYDDMLYWNIGNLKSWEQIWLALVMKEKYGKQWTGEDWESA